MRTKFYFVAALAATLLASCADEKFVGENSPNVVQNESTESAILFGNGFKAVTRAAGDKFGADAADLLGNQFIVLGVKGDGTGVNQTTVFPNYRVTFTQNTAGSTESNTSDWEYVGVAPITGITGVSTQTIKYWDYNTTSYDFAAYSAGKGNAIVTTDPGSNQIQASAISYATSSPAATAGYTLNGTREDLMECYITDMFTVKPANYGNEVVLKFRSLATKVRVALYEAVPGYSIANVKFHITDVAKTSSQAITPATSDKATLIGSAFYTGGTYTVSFPHIGSSYDVGGSYATSTATHSDYNKAHVALTTVTSTDASEEFGELNYTTKEANEVTTTYSQFLKRSSNDPSFAGTSTYYQTVLPKEDGTVLELCVDYTLVPIDGAAETITIYGAKAYVPATYTKWLPNYAYTYIFKISDNTNGWTNPAAGDDPAGLFPITFDAVVLDSEETGHQTTITTVAEPSITTYQKGHVYSATNSYDKAKKVYVQVMQNGALVSDLEESGKSAFYKITNLGVALTNKPADWPNGYYTDAAGTTAAPISFTANTYYKATTEAVVMDALNIRTSGSAPTVVGRNGISLTPIASATPAGTESYTITTIPGEDGNNITLANAGEAGELDTNSGAGTYVYVYDYTPTTPSPDDIYTAVILTGNTAPDDWVNSSANVYYTYDNATDTYTVVTSTYAAGNYYKKYQDLKHTYAVKVIKFE